MRWGWGQSSKDRRRDKNRTAKEAAKLKDASPVIVEGRKIVTTFWGKAWCDNLESYSDYENRLPRGRTYARNGSVADLRIESGLILARVSGSRLYKVTIKISEMPTDRWKKLTESCTGSISSLIELLEGRLSEAVMHQVIDRSIGLFPNPKEISLSCSCPDWATMCKHVAAVMYGVGNRLDQRPELLFTLRRVDPQELLASPGALNSSEAPPSARIMTAIDLWDIFEIEQPIIEAELKTGKQASKGSMSVKKVAAKIELPPKASTKRSTRREK